MGLFDDIMDAIGDVVENLSDVFSSLGSDTSSSVDSSLRVVADAATDVGRQVGRQAADVEAARAFGATVRVGRQPQLLLRSPLAPRHGHAVEAVEPVEQAVARLRSGARRAGRKPTAQPSKQPVS